MYNQALKLFRGETEGYSKIAREIDNIIQAANGNAEIS